jgi:hypothetical protein
MTPPDPAALRASEPEPVLGAGFNFTDPRSPLAPYYLRTSHLVAVGMLGLLFVFLSAVPLWHTDVWGHLKFGQWMVEHDRLPDREPFSADADPAAPGLHAYWLCQSGLYLLYHAGELVAGGDAVRRTEGGVLLLRTLHALVVTLRCLVLLFAFRRLRCSWPLALTGLALLLVLAVGHIAILRPQVFGEFCFACLLLALSRPLLSRRALVLVPLLLVVWANSHGSWVIGLVLLAVFLLGRAVEAGLASPGKSPRAVLADDQVRRLGLALGCSLLAVGLFNPHGPFIYETTLAMGRHPSVTAMDEWQSLFSARGVITWWIYLPAVALAVTAPVLSQRRPSATQVLVLLVFAVQPLLHQRMMVWWLMVVPWLVLPHVGVMLGRLKWSWLHFQSVPSFRKTVVAGLLVLAVVVWSAPVNWLLSGKPSALEQSVSQGTPWQLARHIERAAAPNSPWPQFAEALRPHLRDGRLSGSIFASETLGDYLLWSQPLQTPVVIYSHVHLFPAAHWEQVAVVKNAAPGWQNVLDGHGVNLVLIEPELHTRLRQALLQDPAWQVVLDETGSPAKRDPRSRWLLAVRKQPLPERPMASAGR